MEVSPNPISDENNRRKLQTKISDENLKQYLSEKFVTKQHMLGVKKIKQLKRVISHKADFATKQRMLGVKIFVQN